jgi:hypothetical protein
VAEHPELFERPAPEPAPIATIVNSDGAEAATAPHLTKPEPSERVLLRRYRDAYFVANVTVTVGKHGGASLHSGCDGLISSATPAGTETASQLESVKDL